MAAFAGALPLAGLAENIDIAWTGTTSTSWFDSGNWSTGKIPTASDFAEINTTSPNAASLTGSAASVGNIIVGNDKAGSLTISDGGALSVGDTLAISEGGGGTVIVDGAGASLTVGDEVNIGDSGTGSLILSNGGSMTVEGLSILSMGNDENAIANLVIGATSGSAAVAAGALSVDTVFVTQVKEANLVFNHTATEADPFDFSPQLQIFGSATNVAINVEGGHTTFSTDLSSFGGSVLVDGGTMVTGSALVAETITVGDTAKGSVFEATGGNDVTTKDLVIGNASGSSGTMTLEGANLDVAGTFRVGGSGTGTLVLAEGSVGTADGGAGTIAIASGSGSTGTLAIGGAKGSTPQSAGAVSAAKIAFGSGDGTLLFNHTASASDPLEFSTPITGNGTIAVERGTTRLTVANTGFGGTVAVNRGSLEVPEDLKASALNVGNDVAGASMLIENLATVTAGTVAIGVEQDTIGTLTVSGSSRQGTQLTRTTLNVAGDLLVGSEGTGTLILAEDSEVAIDNFKGTLTIADQAGAVGTLVIGAAQNETPVAAGNLFAAKLEFGDGIGQVVFNHTTDDYEFTQPTTGVGTLISEAGETNLTGDHSGFEGQTIVNGGILSVNDTLTGEKTVLAGEIVVNGGTLSINSTATGPLTVNGGLAIVAGTSTGDILVADGGTLAGSGTATGSITAQSGGTIQPGAKLTTADVTFESGSIFALSVGSTGDATLLNATGAVTVEEGAKVSVISDTYAVKDSFSYTVLTPEAGRTGTFAKEVDGSTALIKYTLNYIGDNVILTQTAQTFSSLGTSDNHAAVGGALDSLPTLHPVVQHTYGLLSEAEVLETYDRLSGEIHASVKSVLMDNDRNVSAAVNRRLAGAYFAPADAMAQGADLPDDGWQNAAWIAGYGGWGRLDSTSGTASIDNDYGGVVAGFDHEFGEVFRLGVFGAYGYTSVEQSARAASADVNSVSGGLYGSATYDGAFANFGGLGTWHGIETGRGVTIAGTPQNLDADYDAASWQLFGEAGYGFEFDRALIEPFAGASFMQLHTDGFAETGGSAALAAGSEVDNNVMTVIGLRGGFQITPMVRAHGTVGWRHTFGDVDPETTFTLAGSAPFSIAGAPIARDELLLSTGFEVKVRDRLSLGASYSGQFGDGSADNQFEGRLLLRF